MNRPVWPLFVAIFIVGLGIAGCDPVTGNEVPFEPPLSGVGKTCESGRAVYTFKYGNAGGLAVIDRAPECPQPSVNP